MGRAERNAEFAARRYAPMEQVFMDAHVAELEELGLIERNYISRWASAA
ncbi:hypothetical protein PI125_g1988 [Phytophthora idaei]|nr:hypothetical protein PI125_g1988 [Phytophthora idaei]